MKSKRSTRSIKQTVESKLEGWLSPKVEVLEFETLYRRECGQMGEDSDWELVIDGKDNDEPWVAFTPKDHFGIALSGGGIRSATFNLGLLQSFAALGVLPYVDYLSTVSGGGYIGGFWSTWLRRQREHVDRPGPSSPFERSESGEETREIRHLREFSRFLLPRLGVLETEFWGIVMTVLGGFVPAFLTALAVLGLGWSVWLVIIAVCQAKEPFGLAAFAVLAFVFMQVTERRWQAAKKSEPDSRNSFAYQIGSVVAIAAGVGAWLTNDLFLSAYHFRWSTFLDGEFTVEKLPASLRPVLALAEVSLAALIIRIIVTRAFRTDSHRSTIAGVERVASRVLALCVGAATIAGIWLLAVWVSRREFLGTGAVGTITGVFAALFAWLHNWFSRPVVQTRASALLTHLVRWSKKATPQVLAWIVVVGLHVLVAIGLQVVVGMSGEAAWAVVGWWTGGCSAIILLTFFLFDPARIGLHEFYRSKISRCYLGASNPRPGPNREGG